MTESSSLAIVGTTNTIYANSVHPLLLDGGDESGEPTNESVQNASPDASTSQGTESSEEPVLETAPGQQTDTPDWKSPFLDAKTPEDLIEAITRNEKTRSLYQSRKDQEIARERTRLEQSYQAQFAAQQEWERLNQLSDEELGSEFRRRQQIQEYDQEVATRGKYEWMVESYRQTAELVGPETWQKVVDAVGSGQLYDHGPILAYALELKSRSNTQAALTQQDHEIAKRVEERVQLELTKRTANGHLAETSPDTSRPIASPGARTYVQSDIDKLPWDYAITNPREMAEIEKAFYAGRVVQGR